MSRQPGDNLELGIWFDPHFIIRTIRKWIIVILCLAIMASVSVYIGANYVMKNSYSASMIVTVLSRQNNANAMSGYNFNNAINRNIDMWSSDILKETIKEQESTHEVKGNLTAQSIGGSGLILLSATGDTAEEAYYLLKAATKYSGLVDSSFDTNFYSIPLTRATSESIRVQRTSPKKYAVLAFGAVLVGCMGLFFVWSLFTKRIHSIHQATDMLDVPVMDSLPKIKSLKKKTPVRISDHYISLEYLDAFEHLTSNVESSLRRHNKTVLMVTSISENEGKSTASVNLAMSLSKRGYKTLLVDMDLRNPSVYKILDVKSNTENQIIDVLEQKTDIESAAIRLQNFYGIYVLGLSSVIKNADQFLENGNVSEFLTSAKKEYDFVIIDTPPVGPVRDADVVAALSECILLVVRQDFTMAQLVDDAIDTFTSYDTECIGVVINQSQHTVKRKKLHSDHDHYTNYYRRVGNQ